MSDTPDAPPEMDPPASANGTNWDLVKRLKAEGVTPADAVARLKATGLDDESAKVLVNSVMGAMPTDIPSAQLTPGTNILAPAVFTLSDIGLTGSPTVVGVYWIGFGAAILLALGVGFMMTATDLVKLPDDVGYYAVRLCGVASMTCIAWGAFRYSQGITIRRK